MIVLLLIVMLVLLLELLNSALERFADLLKPRLLVHVETVKNIMAAMVLLASVFSSWSGHGGSAVTSRKGTSVLIR